MTKFSTDLEEILTSLGHQYVIYTGTSISDISDLLESESFAGVISNLSPQDERDCEKILHLSQRLPWVSVINGFRNKKICYVGLDNKKAIEELYQHFQTQSYSTILFLSLKHQENTTLSERYQSFLSCRSNDPKATSKDKSLILSQQKKWRQIQITEKTLGLLDRWWKPFSKTKVGIIAFSDGMAVQILDWATRRKIQIPSQLGLAGIDGAYLQNSAYSHLTTISYPPQNTAQSSVQLLLQRIKQPKKTTPQQIKLKGVLHLGSSTRDTVIAQGDPQQAFLHLVLKLTALYFQELDPTEKIATHLEMSRAHFRRKYFQSTQESYAKFLLGFRLNRACLDLEKTSQGILEIATASGFENITHFNRVFKKTKLLSPRDFRNRFKKKSKVEGNKSH